MTYTCEIFDGRFRTALVQDAETRGVDLDGPTAAAGVEPYADDIARDRKRLLLKSVAAAAAIAGTSVERIFGARTTVTAMIEASRRIGEIVGMISVIARQTNSPALNAAIKAQRVGETGNGFAMAAAEVKALVDQTERASREATAHIGRVQSIAGEAEAAIRGTLETVTRIEDIAVRVVRRRSAKAGRRRRRAESASILDGRTRRRMRRADSTVRPPKR